MAGGLRVFSGGACIVLGGSGSGGSILPPTPVTTPTDQSAVERSMGLPQALHLVVAYQGNLMPSMGVPANQLNQEEDL